MTAVLRYTFKAREKLLAPAETGVKGVVRPTFKIKSVYGFDAVCKNIGRHRRAGYSHITIDDKVFDQTYSLAFTCQFYGQTASTLGLLHDAHYNVRPDCQSQDSSINPQHVNNYHPWRQRAPAGIGAFSA